MPSLEGSYRPVRLGVVVSGWPRVSETFALNELLALRRAGLLHAIFATKAGDATARQPDSDSLDALVEMLPDLEPAEQGEHVAKRMAELGLDAIHGYFAHRPAEVAEHAARLAGTRFGFSCHALDVRKVAPDELARRAAAAAVVVACNRDVAASIAATGTEPTLLAHGVDLHRFSAATPRPDAAPDAALQLLAVGRLVEKKGFVHLLDALARTTTALQLQIVGEGPERAALEAQAERLGLGDRVRFCGRRTHHELPALYASADIVAVPSVVDRNGDRDGLPNVVLEAMAARRAVVASDVAAVATAITDGHNGLLVSPGDAGELAAALDRLAAAPELRRRLAAQARRTVEERFDLQRCGAALCRLLGDSYD